MTAHALAFALLLAYDLVVLALLPLVLRAWTRTPREVVRKVQHLGFAASPIVLMALFTHWWAALIASTLLLGLAYPMLWLIERSRFYHRWSTDRDPAGGELRRQVLFAQATTTVLLGVLWGGLGDLGRPLVAVASVAWGFGDAAAALVGKAWGRHGVVHRDVEGTKTWEGAAAMVAVVAASVFAVLLVYGGHPWWVALVAALVAGPVAAATELVSHAGLDTVTVPCATAAVLAPWLWWSSAAGW
ncbi:MAG: phosphatidate cytidylyltransferase [Trueperaceae bacterium]